MAENFAQAFRTVAASTAGTAYVDSVVAMLSHASQTRWVVTSSVAGKALLTCIATGSQVVLHGAPAQVQVGFAPDGGVTSWDTSPTAPVWTGLRNITQNTSGYTGTTATMHLAAYEDALVFFIGSSIVGFRFACHVGKIIEPLDLSDVAAKVGVDALILGIPSNVSTDNTGNWLRAATGATWVDHGSCFRIGNVFSPLWALGLRYVSADNVNLSRVGGVERMVPFIAQEQVAGTGYGILGATRYIRQWRNYLPHGTRLASDDPTSNQAWLGWQPNTLSINNNQVILWNKTEVAV